MLDKEEFVKIFKIELDHRQKKMRQIDDMFDRMDKKDIRLSWITQQLLRCRSLCYRNRGVKPGPAEHHETEAATIKRKETQVIDKLVAQSKKQKFQFNLNLPNYDQGREDDEIFDEARAKLFKGYILH